MEAGQQLCGHRQGEQQLVAVVPLAVDGEDGAGLRRDDLALDRGGCTLGPGRDAQVQRERGALAQADRDADAAACGIAALDVQANRSAREAVAHLAGRVAGGVEAVVSGEQPLAGGEARPRSEQRAERFAVLQGEEIGRVAREREARVTGNAHLVGLLDGLHAVQVRRKRRGDAVVHERVELIGGELSSRAGEQQLQRRGQLAQGDGRHAAAGMRARQQRIAGDAAADRAVRLVHAGQALFRRSQVLARAGDHRAQRAGAQTLAEVGGVGGAQQMVRVAVVLFPGKGAAQLGVVQRPGDGRAVREGAVERGVVRALGHQGAQHGEDRLLPGDVVQEDAGLHRVADVHGLVGGQRRRLQRVPEELHVAQHEGEHALVAGHGVRRLQRAQHAAARGKGLVLRAEAAVLALAGKHRVAKAQGRAAQLLVAQQAAGEQRALQHIGRVHAGGQLAAEPGAF